MKKVQKKTKKNVFYLVRVYFFLLVPARAPKWRFFNLNTGTGLKNPHFWGSYTHSEKNIRARWGEGEPPILPLGGGTPFLSAFWAFWVKVAFAGEFLGPLWSARY